MPNISTSKPALVELLRQVSKDLVALGLSDDSGYLKARASQCRQTADAIEAFRVINGEDDAR